MTKEEAKRRIEICRNFLANNYSDMGEPNFTAFNMAIKALEQEPCEDCINRQAVLDIQVKYAEHIRATKFWQMRDDFNALPSVKPQEPKTGHWEYVQYDGNPNIGNWHCSECNRIVSGAIIAVNPVYVYKYCPNCGAKMEEKGEEQWKG